MHCIHAQKWLSSTFHLMFKDFQDRSSHVETKAAHESAEQRQPEKVWWQKIWRRGRLPVFRPVCCLRVEEPSAREGWVYCVGLEQHCNVSGASLVEGNTGLHSKAPPSVLVMSTLSSYYDTIDRSAPPKSLLSVFSSHSLSRLANLAQCKKWQKYKQSFCSRKYMVV